MNTEKFQNAVLYFSKHCKYVGRVKLAKLLYFLDFDHFGVHSKPITDACYRHKQFGPMPDQFDPMIKRMKELGRIEVDPIEVGRTRPMDKIRPLVDADMGVFDAEEQLTLKAVTKRWKLADSDAMIRFAHNDVTWKYTNPNEVVPYSLAFHRKAPAPSSR